MISTGLIFLPKRCSEDKGEKTPEKTMRNANPNINRALELEDDIFKFIVLVEGEARFDSCAYYDQDLRTRKSVTHIKPKKVKKGRWTTHYGVTVKPNGSFLKPYEKVEKATAKEWSLYHLRNKVFPFLCHFERNLSDREIMASCLFIYNIGGEVVTGYRANGKKFDEPSKFFTAINQGKDAQYSANCMTRYRRSAGKRANGLLKRHWVQGAVLLGVLDSQNVERLRPEAFYETKNFGNYYWLDKRRQMIEKGGLYQLRYDSITVSTFFETNVAKAGQKSVFDILP